MVALAVGRTTLPHYAGIDPDAPGLPGKIFLPVDELVPAPADASAAFSAQLCQALPAKLSDFVAKIAVQDPERAAARMEALVAEKGVALCVLGLGPDGHIAFNQPGSGPDTRTRLVEILAQNLSRLGDVTPAAHALTLGVASLLSAERILLVVDGVGKEAALERVLNGPESRDLPATFLRRHSDCHVFVVGETESTR